MIIIAFFFLFNCHSCVNNYVDSMRTLGIFKAIVRSKSVFKFRISTFFNNKMLELRTTRFGLTIERKLTTSSFESFYKYVAIVSVR